MKATSFRFTDEVKAALARLAKTQRRTQVAVVEMLILDAAKRLKGVK